MRRLLLALLMTGLATLAFSQDSAPNIYDVKFKYDQALRRIEGVVDVSVAGVNGETRIVIRVATIGARDAVRQLCGERLEGHAVHVIVSPPSPAAAPSPVATATCTNCACPCHKRPGQTVAEPRPKIDLDRLDDRNYAVEQCDVLREWVGLPKRQAQVRCQQMVGWTNDPDKIRWVINEKLPHWDSQEMPGLRAGDGVECGSHGNHKAVLCYTYIKHRQFCPMGMRQILKDIESLNPGK